MKRNLNPMRINACLTRTWTSCTATFGSFLLLAILLASMGLQDGPLFAQETAAKKADPLDWTFWRGPSYNGTSVETGLIDDWDPRGGEGSNVAWRREDLCGRSTPIVMNG